MRARRRRRPTPPPTKAPTAAATLHRTAAGAPQAATHLRAHRTRLLVSTTCCLDSLSLSLSPTQATESTKPIVTILTSRIEPHHSISQRSRSVAPPPSSLALSFYIVLLRQAMIPDAPLLLLQHCDLRSIPFVRACVCAPATLDPDPRPDSYSDYAPGAPPFPRDPFLHPSKW